MTDYRKQFNERLTTATYQHYIYNPLMEEDDDEEREENMVSC